MRCVQGQGADCRPVLVSCQVIPKHLLGAKETVGMNEAAGLELPPALFRGMTWTMVLGPGPQIYQVWKMSNSILGLLHRALHT